MVWAAPGPTPATILRRILLPLLLCLTLIASAVGSAWATTAMAMPTHVAIGSAEPRGCDDVVPGLHADRDSGHPAPSAWCGDGKHCECPQHSTAVTPALLPLLAGVARIGAPLPAQAAVASTLPDRLIRPPIA